MLLDIPKNFDLDYLDESSLKTPKKLDINNNNNAIPKSRHSSFSFNDSNNFTKNSQNNINIKNFDDFKILLKDLKLTLNVSNYSNFNENFEEDFKELEITLHNYKKL